MKPISTSTFSFEELVGGGCVYVDKTQYLYRLVSAPRAQVFCARPRRFGKSLVVSTLEAIFRGRRGLFRGLAIDDKGYGWESYPVVHLDMASAYCATQKNLDDWLMMRLRSVADEYGVPLMQGVSAPIAFDSLIDKLYDLSDHTAGADAGAGRGVVLLVDEYDKPLTDNIGRPSIPGVREELEGFYQVIKAKEPKLRFTLITGITKFSQMSIFSKLNNLVDISMDPSYACMFGYTQAELEHNFAEHIDAAVAAGAKGPDGARLGRQDVLAELRARYDGFCFHPDAETVYNPVSVGKYFSEGYQLRNYWYATGTPSLLVQLARRQPLYLSDLSSLVASDTDLNSFDIEDFAGPHFSREDLVELLLQAGYLTIGGWGRGFGTGELVYRLRYPNEEVASSFEQLLVTAYTGHSTSTPYVQRILEAAWRGDTKRLMDVLQGFFADVPYTTERQNEDHFKTVIYCIFKLSGMDVRVEEATNVGRIDAVLDAGAHLYIIELKLGKSAEVAASQIEALGYAQKYQLAAREKGQQVHRLGIDFSVADRNISSWVER